MLAGVALPEEPVLVAVRERHRKFQYVYRVRS